MNWVIKNYLWDMSCMSYKFVLTLQFIILSKVLYLIKLSVDIGNGFLI